MVNDLFFFGGIVFQIGGGSFLVGEFFCVFVIVDNFLEIVGMFFIVNYDFLLLVLEFVENVNIFLNGFSSNGNIGQFFGGFIIVNWIDNMIQFNMFLLGVILFEVCFWGIDCGMINFVVIFDVVSIEFFNSNEELLLVDVIDVFIVIINCILFEIEFFILIDVDCDGNVIGSIDIMVIGGILFY